MKLVECPRDAMQGLSHFVPTEIKAKYLNILLEVGFDTLDFGSFVSPKTIPQMRDTSEVLKLLNLSHTKTKLLAIVANLRGVKEAIQHEQINYLGFPFSISEQFQQRNTNSSRLQSLDLVEEILTICNKNNKQAVIYLSMGFGNPYQEEWNADIVQYWTNKLAEKGTQIIAISDTVGVSTPETIKEIYSNLNKSFSNIEFGLHLHSTPQQRKEKIEAAIAVNCQRFDSALKGFGGCPMADNQLTGNIASEDVIDLLQQKGQKLGLNLEKWLEAQFYSSNIFT